MARKLHKAEGDISKYLQTLNRRSNRFGPRSATALVLSGVESRKDIKIKTQTNLDAIQDNFEEKVKEILDFFRNWEQILIGKEEELKHKFEASLCEEGSIDGISRLIKESFVVIPQNYPPDDPELNDTVFK